MATSPYSLIDPWSYGLQDWDVLSKKGWNAGLDEETGQFTVRTQEGSRIGEDAYGTELSNLLNFRNNEVTRQQNFLNNAIPIFQNKRSDIWNAYNSAYGDDAAKNLYLHLGNNFGADNLLQQPDYQLSKFISGPTQLFKDAASKPSHFKITPGAGYLNDFGSDFSKLDPSSIGLFLGKDGKPIVGGVSSKEKDHGLNALAPMAPIMLGSAFMGGALGGAFPGVDAAGAYMAPGTTGLSISSGLGLDLPSWLSSGIDKTFNNVLTSAVQGKNPLDNPMGLAMPFLKGGLGDLGSIFGGGSEMADTFNTAADSFVENTSNIFDGGGMDDWDFGIDDWWSGTGNDWGMEDWSISPYSSTTAEDILGKGVGWTWEDPNDPYYGIGDDGGETDWWKKLMPSGDMLLKLGILGLGGALGGTNGSKEAGKTTTTTSNVPDWALPYVQGILAQGAGINATQGYNPVPMDLANLAAGQMGRTIRGDYLNLANNPQWQDLSTEMADAYKRGTSTNRNAQFARANALGSTAYAQQKSWDDQAYGRSLAGLAGNIYGQERTNQERASTLAPDWSRSYQQVPYGNLMAYRGLLSGWGGSQSQPYYTNPYAGILGGISAAGSIFGKNGIFGD